jgi:hypothetical protein
MNICLICEELKVESNDEKLACKECEYFIENLKKTRTEEN